ncbi:hypothetical protein [Streptomyces sp. C36]|uniref:hypothetical protein n=1 Tax=Streptomyces sp. C36 TaxID=3237122 RepID=UPI0034C68F19
MTDRRRGGIPRDMQDQQASGPRRDRAVPKGGKGARDRREARDAGTEDAGEKGTRRRDEAAGTVDPATGEPPD